MQARRCHECCKELLIHPSVAPLLESEHWWHPEHHRRPTDHSAGALQAPELKTLFPTITFCNSTEHSLPLCTLLSASSVLPTITTLKFFFQATVSNKCGTVTTSTVFFILQSYQLFQIPCKSWKTKQKKTIILQCNYWLLYDVVATTHILPREKVLACQKRRVAFWAYLWISCRLTTFVQEDHVDPLLLHQTWICRQACHFFPLKVVICDGNQASKFNSSSLQILFFIIPKLLFQYPYYSSIFVISVLFHITLQELVLKHSVASRFLAAIIWYISRVETFTDTIWWINAW